MNGIIDNEYIQFNSNPFSSFPPSQSFVYFIFFKYEKSFLFIL